MLFLTTKDTQEKEILIRNALAAWDACIDFENVSFLTGGSCSIAVRAGEFVFRFPLTKSVFEAMRREADLTEALNKHLSSVAASKVPVVRCAEPDGCVCFSYHRYIHGKIMDNIRGETAFNTCYCNLTEKQRDCLAQEIASFLSELHSLSAARFSKEWFSESDWDFTEKIDEEKSREMLLRQSGGLLDLNDFKTPMSRDIVLCHNDLSGSNLLVLPENESILSGVIDFANANLCSAANDFMPMYKIGRDLVCRVIRFYNQCSKKSVDMRELDYRFLCFVCFLLEQQKKPSFFITALIENFLKSFF